MADESVFSALAEIFAGKEHLVTSTFIQLLQGFFEKNIPQTTYLALISEQLVASSLALYIEQDPPLIKVSRVAILLTLMGEGKSRQMGFGLLSKGNLGVDQG